MYEEVSAQKEAKKKKNKTDKYVNFEKIIKYREKNCDWACKTI